MYNNTVTLYGVPEKRYTCETTAEVTSVTQTSAPCGGAVISRGDAEVVITQ